MSTILALLTAAVFAIQDPAPAPAPAQEDGEGGRRPRRVESGGFGGGGFQWGGGGDQTEARVQGLKQYLGLSDEQTQKTTDIYKQTRDAEQKLETERQAKVRELLTDDQKKKYDEMIVNQARSQGPLGFLDRQLSGFADRLKRELSLDDATHEKVKAHIEEFRKKLQERGEKFRQGGETLDWRAETQSFQDGAKETGEKIKGHLSSEQKEKFDKIVEETQQRGRMGGMGERPKPPTSEERATRVMNELKIADASEAAVAKAAIVKVFDAQTAVFEHDREQRGKLDELQKDTGMTDEQLNNRLNELKTARLEKDKALKAAQAELRGMITARQELELIRNGVFR